MKYTVDVNEELEEIEEEQGPTIAAAPPIPDALKTKDPEVWARWTEYWRTTDEGKEWIARREAAEAEKVERVQALFESHKGENPVFDALASASEFPEGYSIANPPPSGFVDESEVYEEVNYSPERIADREKEKTLQRWQDYERYGKENGSAAETQLLGNGDAMFWANEFVRIREERLASTNGRIDIASSVDTMVGWFANAFQRGEWNSRFYREWADAYIAGLDKGRNR